MVGEGDLFNPFKHFANMHMSRGMLSWYQNIYFQNMEFLFHLNTYMERGVPKFASRGLGVETMISRILEIDVSMLKHLFPKL